MIRTQRRERWRNAVLRYRSPRMTGEVRALLLVLADRMDRNANVSVPRKELAEMFDVPESRITERVQRAHEVGLLVTVHKGRPGRTAVYQGTVPPPVEKAGWRGSATTDPEGVRQAVPVTTGTSRRTTEPTEKGPSRRAAIGSNGVPVDAHLTVVCPSGIDSSTQVEITPRLRSPAAEATATKKRRPSPYLRIHREGADAEKNRQLRELELLMKTEMTG